MEQVNPKQTRTYEGEQLERRRAYQRKYNQKKRAAEKAKPKAPKAEVGTFVTQQIDYNKAEETQARLIRLSNGHVRETSDYLALLESERVGIPASDWYDENREYFADLCNHCTEGGKK